MHVFRNLGCSFNFPEPELDVGRVLGHLLVNSGFFDMMLLRLYGTLRRV